MRESDILIVGGEEIRSLLSGRERAILQTIRHAYQIHERKQSSLPHSTFLHFPDQPANRIIALPAYLGGEINTAGVKWIASFPANIHRNEDRASAVLILNSMESGRPRAIMEGSIISAKRTAASAAVAADALQKNRATVAGVVGCGPINFEIVQFLLVTCPEIETIVVYDRAPERARSFQERCHDAHPGISVRLVSSVAEVMKNATLISLGTNAGTPYIEDLAGVTPGSVILNVSLRDLSPRVILSSDNVVDDIDHVCRAGTSIHLAEQEAGNRQFIRCTLGAILNGDVEPHRAGGGVVIFSPFGLGILDIALGDMVSQLSVEQGNGTAMPSFLPDPWRQPFR